MQSYRAWVAVLLFFLVLSGKTRLANGISFALARLQLHNHALRLLLPVAVARAVLDQRLLRACAVQQHGFEHAEVGQGAGKEQRRKRLGAGGVDEVACCCGNQQLLHVRSVVAGWEGGCSGELTPADAPITNTVAILPETGM